MSALGSGLTLIAAPLYVAAHTRSPLIVSATSGVAWLPWLLFALPGGVLVDRVDRRRLMIVIDWVRVAAVGLLAAALLAGRAGQLRRGPARRRDRGQVRDHRSVLGRVRGRGHCVRLDLAGLQPGRGGAGLRRARLAPSLRRCVYMDQWVSSVGRFRVHAGPAGAVPTCSASAASCSSACPMACSAPHGRRCALPSARRSATSA
jgi:MFS family permease